MHGGMRARHLFPVFVLALALPAAAAGSLPLPFGIVDADAPPSTPLRELGYQLFAGNCAICHGPNGAGMHGPAQRVAGALVGQGPPLRGVGELAPDFYLRTGRMPLGSLDEQPSRNPVLLSDRQIRALVAYVGSLGPGPPIPHPHPERGKVNEGRTLFTEHCAGSHQVVAEGGYLTGADAPTLHEATPTQVAQAVRIGPYVMPRFSKRAISDRQLDSIIAYVEYTKSPRDPGGWSLGHVGPIPEGLVAWLIAAAALVAVCLLLGRRLKR
jgi:ubiquinol-cytochrome c reductase cytochrome c subunit